MCVCVYIHSPQSPNPTKRNQANVYYAKSPEQTNTATASEGSESGGPQEYAVKVFKTSILVFKDRDRYVSGE